MMRHSPLAGGLRQVSPSPAASGSDIAAHDLVHHAAAVLVRGNHAYFAASDRRRRQVRGSCSYRCDKGTMDAPDMAEG